MRRTLAIIALLGTIHAAEKDYPLTAVAGIGRGAYPGTYITEIRIGHTVYVSPDSCKANVAWNGHYPARMNSHTIWLLVGSRQCKYRVTDEHPYLDHRTRPSE